ncbi:hypothetical protein NC653_031353 [Populus alba x Populus x berolinensis]|uniref:GST N-terminal domain-containing protein n=1 Tax=Populus alba x Populus x berolinensis TaxID=444605 RepID=A0AAD6LY69_9ROSI|nr:hypothetical protein NC653_031353 [Populus alba x Populus x berolinensis]
MSLLSPKSSPFSLHPSTTSPAPNNSFSFPLTSIPVSTLNRKHPLKFFSNRNWVCLRKRIHVKSPDSDTTESVSASSDGSSSSSSTTSFLSFLCPLLKLFSGGDPSQERNYTLEVATSSLSTLARLPWGSRSLSENLNNQETTISDPPKPLQLYEFEACPFCRRVREAMTELDLSRRGFLFSLTQTLVFQFMIVDGCHQYLRAGRGMTLWEKARLDPTAKKLELFLIREQSSKQMVFEFTVDTINNETDIAVTVSQDLCVRLYVNWSFHIILHNVGTVSSANKVTKLIHLDSKRCLT